MTEQVSFLPEIGGGVPRSPEDEERLRLHVRSSHRLFLLVLFSIVCVFTPVTFLLDPANLWSNAAPRFAVLMLLALIWRRLGDATKGGEGVAEGALGVVATSLMVLFEMSLSEEHNHPFQLAPALFFLGSSIFAPVAPARFLLFGVVVTLLPVPYWLTGSISADWLFRGLYASFVVTFGLSGAVSCWQRRAILVQRFSAERSLKRAGAELEDLGSELTQRNVLLEAQARHLIESRDGAEAAALAKSRFLSHVSHEMRTPLNGILGFTELLSGQFFGELNDRQLGYTKQIQDSGEHLLALINDLLDLTRLEAGALELDIEVLAPREHLGPIIKNLAASGLQGEVVIRDQLGDSTPRVAADRRRFRQILFNLLSNALKFTSKGDEVGVRAERTGAGWLRFEVWDTGVGIEQEQHARIFEEFKQADRSRDEALGGTGLGLSLTRRLVELHGGKVEVESRPGEGSSFFFTVPVAGSDRDSGERRVGLTRRSGRVAFSWPAKGGRVLVVEDNPVNVAVIRGLLEVRGLVAEVTCDGLEALEFMAREVPRLVLMDIHMPRCDGFECLGRMKREARLSEVPVIAMTAGASASEQSRYLSAGFHAFLPKPIESGALDDQLVRFMPELSARAEAPSAGPDQPGVEG